VNQEEEKAEELEWRMCFTKNVTNNIGKPENSMNEQDDLQAFIFPPTIEAAEVL